MKTTPAHPDNSLARLDLELDRLLMLFEQGNWEAIPDMEISFTSALETVRQPHVALTSDPRQIKALLEKLENAINTCSIRKAQIAPLVNALTKTQTKP